MSENYDVIIIGTGFAGSFFLKRYLEKSPATVRVLVLERGASDTKPWQLANQRTSQWMTCSLTAHRKSRGIPARDSVVIPNVGWAAPPE
jgi:choline dehydrogenase-like flavoprotein